MRILFVMRHLAYLRLFEPTLEILANRGHAIHLVFTPLSNKTFDESEAHLLTKRYPSISFETLPDKHFNWKWRFVATWVRNVRDYLRYLDPIYANAPKLVGRKEKLVSRFLVKQLRVGIFSHPTRRATLVDFLKLLEESVPLNKHIREYLRKINPDVVLFTPILDGGNRLIDHAKAAKALGVPIVLCVASWDNLTNKGLIQVEPDKVTVWNFYQRDEAIRHHGVPAERISVTGAQVFDEWFTRKPSCSRRNFLERVGLPSCTRYVLYVCSSVFIAPRETEFIARWLQAVRRTLETQDIGFLIRPHPANIKQWQVAPSFLELQDVTVWPRFGATPINEEAKRDYFDSLYHAEAVVGINSSGMIEAGILGKPVFTILDDDFKDTQEGTIHFRYLVSGGFLHISKNLAEHCSQLAKVTKSDSEGTAKNSQMSHFISEFVRPLGIDELSAPRLADEIESTVVIGKGFAHHHFVMLLRFILWPIAFLTMIYNYFSCARVRGDIAYKSNSYGDSARPLALSSTNVRKKKVNG